MFLTSLGSTETAPAALACSWESEQVGNIGLPLPGSNSSSCRTKASSKRG